MIARHANRIAEQDIARRFRESRDTKQFWEDYAPLKAARDGGAK